MDPLGGVTYTTKTYIIKVTLHDNGDGTITVTADPENPEDVLFENIYEAEGEIDLRAQKTLMDRTLKEGEFSFTLTEVDKDGNALENAYTETVKNDADGKIIFSTIKYTLADMDYEDDHAIDTKHYYKIVEEIPTEDPLGGVTYTTEEHIITVTLHDNGDGTITATADKDLEAKAFDDDFYMHKILQFICQKGSATRDEVEHLVSKHLSSTLTESQRRNKIGNLLSISMRRRNGWIESKRTLGLRTWFLTASGMQECRKVNQRCKRICQTGKQDAKFKRSLSEN